MYFFKSIPKCALKTTSPTTKHIVARNTPGATRKATNAYDKTSGKKAKTAEWYLRNINAKPALHYYNWRVVVEWQEKDTVGVVRSYRRSEEPTWEIYFKDYVHDAAGCVDNLTASELALGLFKASQLGCAGPEPK